MTSSPPLITILLPFYKVGLELDTSIRSIVQQSFSHWKLLLISNNANPEGLQIARDWVQKDSRIELLEETRQGIAWALNAGLQQVRTGYIARMDADDEMFPERLQKQYEYLEQNPPIGVASSQTRFVSQIEGSEGYALFVQWQNSIITPHDHALFRFIESPLAHPSVMFRTSLIHQYGEYSTGEVPEDYELWLRWMDQGVSFYKIPEPLLIWSDHAQRLSRIHSNYSREAFYKIKCYYLARWIRQHVPAHKKIVVCGSSSNGRKRAALLSDNGIDVFGFTDVKKRQNREVNFIPYTQIIDPEPWFLVNFIARRGVTEALREHFSPLGFVEGRDLIMAG